MAIVWPITEAGSPGEDQPLLTYAPRDFYGLEVPASTLTDYRGANEAIDWTRRVSSAFNVEHYLTGAHKDLRINRAKIAVVYTGDATTPVAIMEQSYLVSTTGAVFLGSAAATATRNGVGDYQIDLASAMPSANYSVACSSYFRTPATRLYVGHVSTTSTTRFFVKVWSVANLNKEQAADPVTTTLIDASFTCEVNWSPT